jgi:molybdopterin-guanine dinucleotide biosynthesis protein A
MGRDKATIEWRGWTLWQRQLATLNALQPQEIFVSARARPEWLPNEYRFVPDDTQTAAGPLAGLRAVFRETNADHIAVLAIDLPGMRPDYLTSLVERCVPAVGVVPLIDDRHEPLAAVYPSLAKDFFYRPAEMFSLQHYLRMMIAEDVMKTVKVSPDEKHLFRNLNSPDDLLSWDN